MIKLTSIIIALLVGVPAIASNQTGIFPGTYVCNYKGEGDFQIEIDTLEQTSSNIESYEITMVTQNYRPRYPAIPEFTAKYTLKGTEPVKTIPLLSQEVTITKNGKLIKTLKFDPKDNSSISAPYISKSENGMIEIKFLPIAVRWYKNSPDYSSIHINKTEQEILLKNCRPYGDAQ
ncbi:MAG: hypothetical protein ACOYL6_14370 [Bacteriovoracaceae bacterium]